jgi:hypothetical protein
VKGYSRQESSTRPVEHLLNKKTRDFDLRSTSNDILRKITVCACENIIRRSVMEDIGSSCFLKETK